ncbi:hypothetical protein EV360DRAFT_74637 [Lentinula raphanica]|nr:hypothetical protein EV360DRAFT_74637 [Lentinula raphanica]
MGGISATVWALPVATQFQPLVDSAGDFKVLPAIPVADDFFSIPEYRSDGTMESWGGQLPERTPESCYAVGEENQSMECNGGSSKASPAEAVRSMHNNGTNVPRCYA